jgi:hypothetical protein
MLPITKRHLGAISVTLCALLAACSAAKAQSATGDREVVIGSCAALEGPSSFLGRETVVGAEAYFRFVNGEGGMNRRKLRLVSADDSYDPAKTEDAMVRVEGLKKAGKELTREGLIRGLNPSTTSISVWERN